ncbi:MAG TPA: HD domain-containing phosphohydrolase [Pyrinomonadaceae bacterium]|jgi:HD-GYP domain-containing protein (c-di-GMP phosphodiesterase class II)|nr:HD domain-containing phosphohydrolase [Pyrinomonadaceae bacterium]
MPERADRFIHTFAALADLGQEVADMNSFQQMIRTSLHLLLGSLAIMRGGVARFSRFGGELNFLAMRSMGEDFPLMLSLGRDDVREFVNGGLEAYDLNYPLLNGLPFVRNHKKLFEQKQIELLIPLIVRDELVGLALLGGKASGEKFDAGDKAVICAMARHIGVGIRQRNLMAELERRAQENRQLYEDLKLTYKDTVKAFAAAIDCKDKYTEGHSVRVGRYSEAIALELGWDSDQMEGVAVAGYLHDVGKLTIDRTIINSPTRINAKESAELNKHPQTGYDILMPIHHPFADVPLAAKYHHERIDGRGYPDGLYDRDIPYIAKIVNLADSFDAMTTDRPYKRRRPAEDVIEDLYKNSGKQFAPELVSAFCRSMYKEMTGESKQRQFKRMLGKDYIQNEKVIPMLKDVLNGIAPTSSLTLVSLD